MSSPRRVGSQTSRTRDQLLDCAEQLMIEKGYAHVTYRAVAARAGVTAGLVQYYFPKLDDLFIAEIRRRSEQNLDRLVALLDAHADEPLRVLWEYSRDEATAALTTEFIALGNHRPSIRAEIADVTDKVRRVQLEALAARYGTTGISLGALPPAALLFLLTGIPKLIRLEEGVGVSTTHGEAVRAFESFLDSVEPASRPKAKKPTKRAPAAKRSR